MAYKHYFSHRMWDNYSTDMCELKYRELLDKIPAGVNTILDVGCGDGQVTARLAKHWQVTGTDFSPAALEHVTTPKILAPSHQIPVDGNSFDLVLSSQMLEHLETPLLKQTAAEFVRIAARYILVSVPHAEALVRRQTKCPRCGTVFHAHGHMQSFTEQSLAAYFAPHFFLRRRWLGGPLNRNDNPWLAKLKHHWPQGWFTPTGYTQCPRCGLDEFPEQTSPPLLKALNLADRLITPNRPYWMFLLLQKCQKSYW